MGWLTAKLGSLLGIHFTPDNHVVPVLRFGRFSRVQYPGHFWCIPVIEETLLPVNVGLQVGNFKFDEVLSRDNIPFTMCLTVLFQFNPALPPLNVLAQMVRLPLTTWQNIVKDYTSQGLRRLASGFCAEELGGKTVILQIERNLADFLRAQLHIMGLVPLRQGGILIKEVVAPERFKQAMLHVKQHRATLEMLQNYPEELVTRAIQADFLTGLEDHGSLNLISSLDGMMTLPGLVNGHSTVSSQASRKN